MRKRLKNSDLIVIRTKTVKSPKGYLMVRVHPEGKHDEARWELIKKEDYVYDMIPNINKDTK